MEVRKDFKELLECFNEHEIEYRVVQPGTSICHICVSLKLTCQTSAVTMFPDVIQVGNRGIRTDDVDCCQHQRMVVPRG